MTPTSGEPQCTASRGVLTVRDGNVTFAPDEGTWVLTGKAGPSTLEASKSRNTSDKKLYETKLEAHWTPTNVAGTYTTPRCTFHVELSSF